MPSYITKLMEDTTGYTSDNSSDDEYALYSEIDYTDAPYGCNWAGHAGGPYIDKKSNDQLFDIEIDGLYAASYNVPVPPVPRPAPRRPRSLRDMAMVAAAKAGPPAAELFDTFRVPICRIREQVFGPAAQLYGERRQPVRVFVLETGPKAFDKLPARLCRSLAPIQHIDEIPELFRIGGGPFGKYLVDPRNYRMFFSSILRVPGWRQYLAGEPVDCEYIVHNAHTSNDIPGWCMFKRKFRHGFNPITVVLHEPLYADVRMMARHPHVDALLGVTWRPHCCGLASRRAMKCPYV